MPRGTRYQLHITVARSAQKRQEVLQNYIWRKKINAPARLGAQRVLVQSRLEIRRQNVNYAIDIDTPQKESCLVQALSCI